MRFVEPSPENPDTYIVYDTEEAQEVAQVDLGQKTETIYLAPSGRWFQVMSMPDESAEDDGRSISESDARNWLFNHWARISPLDHHDNTEEILDALGDDSEVRNLLAEKNAVDLLQQYYPDHVDTA